MNENQTIKELIEVMKDDEMVAGNTCNESEGTQGCEEANELLHIRTFIERNYLNRDNS